MEGKLFNRRNLFRAMGGLALYQKLRADGCSVLSAPSLTEGPYFVDENLNRSDIRIDPADDSIRAGIPLDMVINVSQLINCTPVPLTGAYVDIWHCDASGLYSDVSAQQTVGHKYLRGYQGTDRNGDVRFTTIFPGWYQGRTVHIHAKIRTFNGYDQTYEFTTQFFFDDSFTDLVYNNVAPYTGRANRDTRNANDGIYSGASSLGNITSNAGTYLMVTADRGESRVTGTAKLVLDPSLGSSPDDAPAGGGAGGPGGGPGPGGPPPARP